MTETTVMLCLNLFPGRDLALAAMDEGCVRAADRSAPQPRRPAARNRAASSPAPGWQCDPQCADARKGFANGPVGFGDQKRQAEHLPPNLPLGDDVVGIGGGE